MKNVHINPDPCIACTTCTVFCPVAAVTPEYLGPRMMGPAYERFRLLGFEEDKSLSYCSNCKNCEISCPQNVKIASLNMMARAQQMKKNHPHYLRDWIVSHSESLGHMISPVPAGLKNYSMSNPLVRGVLDGIGITKDAKMPSYAPKTFRSLLKTLQQPACSKTVAFFPGCYVDLYDPQTGLDLVWALNRAGYTVVSSPDFCCCGVPMVASGFMDDARKNAEKNLTAVKRFVDQGIPVLTGCPSCELMFKEEIPTFYPELAETFAGISLTDAQEFLLSAFDRGELAPLSGQEERSIIYHAPCHLRALGIGLPGLDLMKAFGITVRPANAGCCGISGSYGFKKEKREVAMKVGAELFKVVKESGAELVASECGTCRLQISSATGVPAVHPVSIIRQLAD